MTMTMIKIGIILIVFVSAAFSVIYIILDPMAGRCDAAKALGKALFCPRYVDLALILTLVVPAIITLFGTLAIEGAKNDDGTFREQRIRLAIAISVLVIYLIYFSMAILWPEDSYNSQLLETLTNLMMVVIPFYFGASAAAEWAEKRNSG